MSDCHASSVCAFVIEMGRDFILVAFHEESVSRRQRRKIIVNLKFEEATSKSIAYLKRG